MRSPRVWLWRLVCLAVLFTLASASTLTARPIATADESTAPSEPPQQRGNQLPDDPNHPRHRDGSGWYDDARELPDVTSSSGIRSEAQAHFGGRYADIWIDRNVSPSRLVFGVVEPTQSDRDFVKQLTKNNARTDVVARKYGAEQLQTWRYEIEPLVERWWKRTGAVFTIGVDPVTASIFIEEDPFDPDLRSEIDALGIPEDAYNLYLGGGGQSTHATRDTFPPYEGGLRVSIGLNCTTWFTGKRDGTPRGVSAGHCQTAPAQHAVIGGTDLGSVGGNTHGNGTDSDALRIAINSSQLTNRIYTAVNLHRTVIAPRFQKEQLTVGLSICFNAVMSGPVCGFITQRDFSAPQDGVDHDHLFEIDGDSVPGDSGAPVYGQLPDSGARVAGIVQGRENGTNDMRFHGAGWVLIDLDMCIYYETTACAD
jgi:hypothetical protein